MKAENNYSQAGVNIAAGQQATELMKTAVKATYTPQVLAGLGAFGGLFEVSHFKEMSAPVLVASTDGVGTKTKVAAKLGVWDTIGQDLVNHCVNDILVQGAQPLFFLDYVASSRLDPHQIATIVTGVATACQAIGCALLGGETAEMPGVYEKGEIDLAGTIVGVVDKADIVDGSTIQPGDCLVGLPATGLHTNGYSLARHVLRDLDWHTIHPALGISIGEALLAIHPCYLPQVITLQTANIKIKGLAHITGGGIVDNLPRVLPEGLGAVIRQNMWPHLPVFKLIQKEGRITSAEMFHVFNMGLGMLMVIPPEQVSLLKTALTTEYYIVGEIVETHTGVNII